MLVNKYKTFVYFQMFDTFATGYFMIIRTIFRAQLALCNKVSISSTFHKQLLHVQIPKVQKVVSLFWAFGICTLKSCV